MPALGNLSYKLRLKYVVGDHKFMKNFTHLSPVLFALDAS
jgi:hypothetical protein